MFDIRTSSVGNGIALIASCSTAGYAWLSTMTDEAALELIARQGFGKPEDFGPRAPTTIKAVTNYLRAARKRGFSLIVEVFAPAMSAMAAPVFGSNGKVVGVVTIAGPLVRLTEERMLELGPKLLAAANEAASLTGASSMFRKRA